MTRNDAIALVFEIALGIECVYKTDIEGTGFYDVSQNSIGYSINKFMGSNPELVAYANGIYSLQFTDHGCGRKSVQAIGPNSNLLADVWYIPVAEVNS